MKLSAKKSVLIWIQRTGKPRRGRSSTSILLSRASITGQRIVFGVDPERSRSARGSRPWWRKGKKELEETSSFSRVPLTKASEERSDRAPRPRGRTTKWYPTQILCVHTVFARLRNPAATQRADSSRGPTILHRRPPSTLNFYSGWSITA